MAAGEIGRRASLTRAETPAGCTLIHNLSDQTLERGQRVTDANPQQKDFLWTAGTKLVDYTNTHGQKLQAALHLPANYQPGKKYPTIVYIYEKLSQDAFSYPMPSDSNVVHVANYTQQRVCRGRASISFIR